MLLYAIKSIIVLSVMYIPYMLILRQESFFRFNRLMLLGIMVLSLTIPLLDVHEMAWEGSVQTVEADGRHSLANGGENSAIGVLLNEVIVRPSGMAEATQTATNEGEVLWIIIGNIYVIGMIITLIVKLIQLCMLSRSIRRGVLWTEKRDGATIYCHADNVAPFSWMNSIVISEQDYQANASIILRHEMGHIRHLHSLDILLLNICQIVQWANPLVWVMANSVRDVHEYEADDTVLQAGVNAQQYQNLLIKKAVGSSSYAFANSFNHSLLKKRITMMLQKKSNPWMRTKALYLIPVAAVALSAFATPELINSVSPETDSEVSNADKVTIIPVNTEIAEAKNVEEVQTSAAMPDGDEVEKVAPQVASPTTVEGDEPDDKIWDIVEELPQYKGDKSQAALMELLMRNLKYPQKATEYGVEGKFLVQFVVEKDGTLSNYNIIRRFDLKSAVTVVANAPNDADAEGCITQEEYDAARKALEDEAIRVIKLSSGDWTPGKQKGKVVRVKYNIPVTYRLR